MFQTKSPETLSLEWTTFNRELPNVLRAAQETPTMRTCHQVRRDLERKALELFSNAGETALAIMSMKKKVKCNIPWIIDFPKNVDVEEEGAIVSFFADGTLNEARRFWGKKPKKESY